MAKRIYGVTITVERTELSKALTRINRIARQAIPKAVLRNARLCANKSFTISATDTEVYRTAHIRSADYQGEAECLVNAKALKSAIPKKGKHVTLQLSMDGVSINGVSVGSTESIDEHPAMCDIDVQATATVNAIDLLAAIENTVYATDWESTRYAIGGLLFVVEDGQLTICGTDGRRLAVAKIEANDTTGMDCQENGKPKQWIVPARSAKQVIDSIKALPAGERRLVIVSIELGGDWAQFRHPGETISTRLVEGRFPNWRDAMSLTSSHSFATFETDVMRDIMSAAATTTNPEARGLDCTFDGETLTIANMCNGQSYHAEFPCDVAIGMPAGCKNPKEWHPTISLNAVYLLEFLKAYKGERFEFGVKDTESAVVLIGDNVEYVLMPLL